ncbi:MAG: DUF2188 domain-containing protein [Clostridia bacterium]|nr:DUF2188 domain-containing protein [Clostridia bacterium]
MAKKTTQHVVHNPNGGWSVKKGGSKKYTETFNTQKEAINKAIDISRNQKAELRIHGADGKIRETRSYGNDPCPPIDRD